MQGQDAIPRFEDRTRGQDCRILRTILSEVSSKKDGFPTLLLHKFQLAGYNDNYLRSMTGDTFQKITGCDEQFAKAVELKILMKIRNETVSSNDSYPLPLKPRDATYEDIQDAVAFYRNHSADFTQKAVIDKFFFERNVHVPQSTLSRRLKSRKCEFAQGRPQLLEHWICEDVITPALVHFRAIGKTKWKVVLRMLMKQLVRAQSGIGPVQGIMELVRNRQNRISINRRQPENISVIHDDDSSGSADTNSESATDLAELSDRDQDVDNFSDSMDFENALRSGSAVMYSFAADDIMDPNEETLRLDDMRRRLKDHASSGSLALTRVDLKEFPGQRTFRRYCKLYGWTQRKIELMAPHRQNGVSPNRITANYAELAEQYEIHYITHPNQVIVCDELHWCKEWGDILEFIQGICMSKSKRSQGDGPARISDGVTVCPFGSIIGYLYLLQVIVKKCQKLSHSDIIDVLIKNGFDPKIIIVCETETGYQTAESFKLAIEALIVRLHVSEGSTITSRVESIRLLRKYIVIADGSSTHPFSDIAFSLVVALAGVFFHQQEPDSTHVCNLYDRFNFLQTKLYSAKEIMMHLAMKFSPRVTNDRQATAWLEEITTELSKTIDFSSDMCPSDLSITDAAVLDKFETIVKCRDSSFDTMHLLECIIPALAKGMQPYVTIASAKAVGLLPSGFQVQSGYNYKENVAEWRGPFVEQVLKQSCVQGQAERELRMERYCEDRQAVVREHMADFGFDVFRAGQEEGFPKFEFFAC
jgi:hypothetical protein